MRPVDKQVPVNSNKEPKTYQKYQNARQGLIDQLGDYCSYCGMQLDADLAVEHVQPKSLNPDLALEWKNFLLACRNCNSTKGSQPIDLLDYYWPDSDNTDRIFIYGEGGTISLNPDLNNEQRKIAIQTLKLTGLDKVPGKDPAAKDRRWLARQNAWDQAQQAKNLLLEQDTESLRVYVTRSAKPCGFWSVWATVFKDDSDMLLRLSLAFPGTYQTFQTSQIRPRS